MSTSAPMLSIRRARPRTWSPVGRTGAERMSAVERAGSGGTPSPEPAPTTGLVATRAAIVLRICSRPGYAAASMSRLERLNERYRVHHAGEKQELVFGGDERGALFA